MKAILVILLALCATACIDGRNSYGRVKMTDAPEFRFSGAYTAQVTTQASGAVPTMHVTYMGRAIRYEEGALYVDDRRLTLPAQARLVAFVGPDIYVDGRVIDSR
jgi:hypothetical protein